MSAMPWSVTALRGWPGMSLLPSALAAALRRDVDLVALPEVIAKLVCAIESHAAIGLSAAEPGWSMLRQMAAVVTGTLDGLLANGADVARSLDQLRGLDWRWWRSCSDSMLQSSMESHIQLRLRCSQVQRLVGVLVLRHGSCSEAQLGSQSWLVTVLDLLRLGSESEVIVRLDLAWHERIV